VTDAIVDLDKVITEILRDAPKLALQRMLREKLTVAGVKARPSSISKAADQILSGAEGELSFGEKAADAADMVNFDKPPTPAAQSLVIRRASA
jgi:hypothetical protein